MAHSPDITKLLESWTESQQKLWTGWMESMQKSGSTGSVQQTWQQGLDRWHEAVEQTLDAQTKAMSAWAEQVGGVEGAPPQAKQWAEGGVKMVEQWSAAQRGLWEQWFALMGKTIENGAHPGADQLQQLMGGWQQVAKKMQDLQNGWAAGLTPGKK